ncbi:hypothetical protein Sjap_014917 [Stephania japonica]|uniref:Uncharacterized protein n=1 Tax=Stephania japonica TaxID=461633 RepID=A0AAP0IIM2_9MAGN
MQLRVEFAFGEKLEEKYFDEEELVSEEEIVGVLFLFGDIRQIDLIFFDEESKIFDNAPKFDSDGYDFVEDKIVFWRKRLCPRSGFII